MVGMEVSKPSLHIRVFPTPLQIPCFKIPCHCLIGSSLILQICNKIHSNKLEPPLLPFCFLVVNRKRSLLTCPSLLRHVNDPYWSSAFKIFHKQCSVYNGIGCPFSYCSNSTFVVWTDRPIGTHYDLQHHVPIAALDQSGS